MATGTVAHWEAALRAADIPCAPVQASDQVLAHPQTEALDIVRAGPGPVRYVGLPLTFDGARPDRNQPSPELGNGSDLLTTGWSPRQGT